MDQNENNRESGARKLSAKTGPDHTDEVSQDAATNKRPPMGIGLVETSSDVDEKTRHSDGQNPSVGDRRSEGTDADFARHAMDPHTQDVGKPKA